MPGNYSFQVDGFTRCLCRPSRDRLPLVLSDLVHLTGAERAASPERGAGRPAKINLRRRGSKRWATGRPSTSRSRARRLPSDFRAPTLSLPPGPSRASSSPPAVEKLAKGVPVPGFTVPAPLGCSRRVRKEGVQAGQLEGSLQPIHGI